MSLIKSEELKETILKHVKMAQEQHDIKLVSGEWGDTGTNCACPLGCILVNNNIALKEDDNDHYEACIQDILNVDKSWVHSFINGFDLEESSYADDSIAHVYNLGKELRKLLLPLND